MSLPAYAEYKDSGVEWLGDVPKDWTIGAIKHFTNNKKGAIKTGPFGSHLTSSDMQSGEIKVYNQRNVIDDDFISGDNFISEEKFKLLKVFEIFSGDVLVTTRGTIGRVSIFPENATKGILHPCLLRIQVNEFLVIADFLKILIQDSSIVSNQLSYLSNSTTIEVIYSEIMSSIVIALPSISEQKKILCFLDYETAKIDALIAEQHRLIELLKEKRQAVISHAVTKGLDPNAPMKDSGVEWLGDVPEHWEVGAIKRFLISLDARRIPLSAEERGSRQGDYPYYGASGIIDTVDDFIFDEDLVLVSEDGANLLSRSTPIAFVARGHFWVNNHAHILKPCDKNLRFWSEQIEHIDLTPFITGSAQPKLTVDALMNLTIATPPCENERFLISSFIEHETAKIDELISHAHQGIDLLKERRSALISAAVTGKIDVRGWQPPATAATTPQGQQQILFED